MRGMMGALAATVTVLPVAAAAQASVKTADYEFDYTYPAAIARFPALRQWFEADKAATRAHVARKSAADRREANTGGYPFHRWTASKEWKVVTETPRFLSLSGESYTYSGGAHGGTQTIAVIWDKAVRRRLGYTDIFVSPAAMQAAFGPRWCPALAAERKKRLQGVDLSGDIFNQCPPIKDLSILLGSTNRQAINRIGLVADQYVAGSYAEGIYEVTLPVTPQVIQAVRPAYRSAFAVQ